MTAGRLFKCIYKGCQPVLHCFRLQYLVRITRHCRRVARFFSHLPQALAATLANILTYRLNNFCLLRRQRINALRHACTIPCNSAGGYSPLSSHGRRIAMYSFTEAATSRNVVPSGSFVLFTFATFIAATNVSRAFARIASASSYRRAAACTVSFISMP